MAAVRRRVARARSKQPIRCSPTGCSCRSPASEGERKSRAGILIPATAQVAKRLAWAEVVAAGPHVRTIKPGDQVLFNPEDRYEVEVQGEDYLILRERDIHAVASERLTAGRASTCDREPPVTGQCAAQRWRPA